MTNTPLHLPAKSQLLRNALFSSGSWGATVVVNLGVIPIFVRYLGVEGYGIYLLLTGLFGYFGLLDFGLSDGVVKYVAHHWELGDGEAVSESVNAALLVQLIAGAVGICVLCVFNQQIIHLLRVSSSLTRAASLGLYVSAVGFLSKMLLNTYNAALKGLQRFDMLGKVTACFSLATSSTVVLVLLLGGRLVAVVVATVMVTTTNLVAVAILLSRYTPHHRVSLLVRQETFRTLFNFGAYAFITRVAGALNTYFLQVIIAVILGASAVAYFAVPLRLTTALEAGMASLVSVIFPFVSALNARRDIECLQRLYSHVSKYVVALSAPAYLFIILFSHQILRIWLGPTFADKGWLVLSLLAVSSLLAIWTMVPAHTIFGTGDIKIAAVFSSIVAGLNLLFSILLTIRLGIAGTAAAVLISATQGPIFVWYVTSRIVGISPRKYFARVYAFHIAPAFGFSLLSITILWATSGQSASGSLVALVLGMVLIGFYYSLLLRAHFMSIRNLGWSD